MIKCPICRELITPSSLTYKISSGFQNEDGSYYEQATIIIHKECSYDYLYNPFEKLEEDIKNS
tara:strand:+ start:5203 stop:5391 length:189 start_codon:yes stop_codon:yes gene_type:complete